MDLDIVELRQALIDVMNAAQNVPIEVKRMLAVELMTSCATKANEIIQMEQEKRKNAPESEEKTE